MLECQHKGILSLNQKVLANRVDDLKIILILQNEMLLLMLFCKHPNSNNSTIVKDHALICDPLVSFDDFKVLDFSNSEFYLKIKEILLLSRDQSILNKNEASLSLHLFDYLRKYFTVL